MPKTPITPQNLARAASELGRDLSVAQAEGLAAYLEALVKWNKAVNLVGPSAWKDILGTLVADSWHLADFLRDLEPDSGSQQGPLTLDIGAGAGLPGIPLRLFWDLGSYSMVEANQKKAAFLQFALSRLSLPRTFVLPVRVEHLGPEFFPTDSILSRAFRVWPDFLALARDKLKPHGLCLIFANTPPPDEASAQPGWSLAKVRPYPVAQKTRYFWAFTPANISK